MKRFLAYLVGVSTVLAAVGCGGSGETILGTDRNPRVRVLNFVSNPNTIDVTVNDELASSSSSFGGVGTYRIVNNGNREVVVRDAVSQGELARSTNLYELSEYYSVAVYNSDSGVAIARIEEDRAVPSGQGQIRFIHLARTVGAVDVYITRPDVAIAGVTPTFSNISQGASSTSLQAYLPLEPGSYTVRVTATGSKVPLLTEDVTLDVGSSKTVYAVTNTTPSLRIVDDRS